MQRRALNDVKNNIANVAQQHPRRRLFRQQIKLKTTAGGTEFYKLNLPKFEYSGLSLPVKATNGQI